MTIDRVYFKEAVYVGTENFPSLPPTSDMAPERRSLWEFAESDRGVTITYKHPQSGGTAFAPWSNVKGVTYQKQKAAK